MSVDIATLGIKIDSTEVKSGSDNLDTLASSGKKAEDATKSATKAFQEQATKIADASKAATALVAVNENVASVTQELAQLRTKLNTVTNDLAWRTKELEAAEKAQAASAARLAAIEAELLAIKSAGAAANNTLGTSYMRATNTSVNFGTVTQNTTKNLDGFARGATNAAGAATAVAGASRLAGVAGAALGGIIGGIVATALASAISLAMDFVMSLGKVAFEAMGTNRASKVLEETTTNLAKALEAGEAAANGFANSQSKLRVETIGAVNIALIQTEATIAQTKALIAAKKAQGALNNETLAKGGGGMFGAIGLSIKTSMDAASLSDLETQLGQLETAFGAGGIRLRNLLLQDARATREEADGPPSKHPDPKKRKQGKSDAEKEAERAAKAAAREELRITEMLEDGVTAAYAHMQKSIIEFNEEQKKLSEDAKEMLEQYQFENDLLKMNAQEREVALAKREMERKGIVEGTLAYAMYAEAILKAAEARGKLDLDAEKASEYADAMRDVNDQLHVTADAMRDIFGTFGEGLGAVLETLGDYKEKQAELNEIIKDGQRSASERARAEAKFRANEIAHYGNLIGAAKGFFKEKSTGYKVLQAAETVYRAFEFAMSLKSIIMGTAETAAHVAQAGTKTAASTAAGAAKMFEQLGIWGFVAVGAMLGLMGALMFGGGGKGGGSQGTSIDDPNDLVRGARTSPGLSVGNANNDNFSTPSYNQPAASRMSQTIQVNNLAPGVEIVADQMTEDKVVLIARKITREDAPKAVADDMFNKNSKTSKALTQNFDVAAKRF